MRAGSGNNGAGREELMKRLFVCAAMAVAAALATFGAGAQTYPTRPITLVVPFAAGSGSDTGARILAEHLGTSLGQRVVVENRPGATGAIGAAVVARAEPDGYTLLIGTNSTHGSNPALIANMAYDPVKNFAPIVRVGIFTYFVVVHPGLPIRSMSDLIAVAKADPERLSYASGSSTSLVMAETFLRGVGIKALRVPFSSNPPALTEVMAGRVSFMFIDVSTSISHVQSGALRALAITSPVRSALAPDLPTVRETVLPGFEMESWIGDALEAGGDIHAVAEEVPIVSRDHIARVNPYAQKNPIFRRFGFGTCTNRLLHLDSACHRCDRASELDQRAVTGGFDEASAMADRGGNEHIRENSLNSAKCAWLVCFD
jgi:tripartite-type tricarboxylate transporter receptor subunit TctC